MIKEQRAQGFFPVARRLSAALLSLSVCVGSLFSFPAYATGTVGPLGDKVESGYDADTWARLQDNVLEYDEIPNLVHEYNSVVSGIWDDLEETRRTLEANAQELESHRYKMERMKETAQEEYDVENLVNYATQEAILKAVASQMDSASRNMLNRSTTVSLQKTENQFVKIAQSLMISYDSLKKQRETLGKLEELYAEQYKLASHKLSLGLATEREVLEAQTSQLSAKSTLASIDGGLLQIRPTLCTMTGWPADGSPEVAPIPSVDLARIDAMNLEEDTRKAIGNNATLISQRTSAKGTSNASISARMDIINEGDQKLTIQMKKLYDDVMSKKKAYQAASDGYQGALKSKAGYDRMYQLGLLGRADYLGTEIAFYQKKAAWETADTALLLAIETYEWAVKGLTEIE